MTTTDFSHETTAELIAGAYGDILAKARAQIAASEEGSPIWVKATKLAEDVSRRMGESLNKETAATGPDTLARSAAALDHIGRTWKDKRNAYEAAMAEGEGARYSDAYRAELLAEYDAGQQSEAENLAKAAWVSYQRAEDAGRQDMQVAYRENESRFDLARIGTLIKDYGAQIQAPPTAQGMGDDRAHRLGWIAQILEQANASGSPDAMRAARIASAPEVQRLMGTGPGTTDTLSRDLHRRLGAMATAERGRVVEVEAAGKQLTARGQALRGSILDLERTMTGRSGSMFEVSAWGQVVLGETMSTFGGGVH